MGKTTLLKAIAAFEIEGMPRHHRILHVRQEIRAAGGDISVTQAVLDADIERNTLIQEEKELLQRLEGEGGKIDEGDGASVKAKLAQLKDKASINESDASFNADLKRLDEVYERLQILGSVRIKLCTTRLHLSFVQLPNPSLHRPRVYAAM